MNQEDQLFSQATSLHQKGELKGAQELYLQLIKTPGNHADALHLCGLTFAQLGQFQEAAHYISRAIQTKPTVPEYYYNLGEAFNRNGEANKAVEAYNHCLRLDPSSIQAYFGKANAFKKLGDFVQAIALYKKTIELNPQFAQGYYNLGNTEKDIGNYLSALEYYKKCIAINGKHTSVLNNAGIVLQNWKKNEEAISYYKKALLVDPNYRDAHHNLAKIYESEGEVEKAQKYYRNLLAFSPNDPLLDFTLKTINPIVFESNEAIDQYHKEINIALDNVQTLPFTPNELSKESYNVFSDSIYHGRDIKTLKQEIAQKFVGNMPQIPVRKPNKKPHIGFVVTNGHEGVFVKCMAGILNKIDKNRFDVSVICSYPNGKRIIAAKLAEEANVNFISIPERFDQAVQIISNARIDILNYWEIGTDTHNYFLPFLRLAPVQCTSWGWPITSGIPNVDYFISSQHLEVSDAQQHYSEKLVCMNRIPVYYYAPPVPDQLTALHQFGFSAEHNLYFCAQNLKKVHPDFDVIVRGILSNDAKGKVIFIEDKHPAITEALQTRLLHTCKEVYEQIVFVPKMDEADYLSLLKQVDVALDTVHYGGGANTCYDAFVCGTPVITLPGQYHRSRYAYAAYQQMEITDCIADDINDYVSKAIALALNSQKRAVISAELLQKTHHVLEDQKAIEELSDVFESLLSMVK